MAKSKAKTPEKVSSAIDSYKKAVDDNTGKKAMKEYSKPLQVQGLKWLKSH